MAAVLYRDFSYEIDGDLSDVCDVSFLSCDL